MNRNSLLGKMIFDYKNFFENQEVNEYKTQMSAFLKENMDSKLNKIVKEGKELIRATPHQDNLKRKISLNTAEKAIDTFEVAMNKLLL